MPLLLVIHYGIPDFSTNPSRKAHILSSLFHHCTAPKPFNVKASVFASQSLLYRGACVESIIQDVINKITKYILSAIEIVRRTYSESARIRKRYNFVGRTITVHLSGKRDGADGGERTGQRREAKENRREKKEIAATRGIGKTETLSSVISLPTFDDSCPFVLLHLEAEEVGHHALFPPIRSPPSYSVFAVAGSTLCHGARKVGAV